MFCPFCSQIYLATGPVSRLQSRTEPPDGTRGLLTVRKGGRPRRRAVGSEEEKGGGRGAERSAAGPGRWGFGALSSGRAERSAAIRNGKEFISLMVNWSAGETSARDS